MARASPKRTTGSATLTPSRDQIVPVPARVAEARDPLGRIDEWAQVAASWSDKFAALVASPVQAELAILSLELLSFRVTFFFKAVGAEVAPKFRW